MEGVHVHDNLKLGLLQLQTGFCNIRTLFDIGDFLAWILQNEAVAWTANVLGSEMVTRIVRETELTRIVRPMLEMVWSDARQRVCGVSERRHVSGEEDITQA